MGAGCGEQREAGAGARPKFERSFVTRSADEFHHVVPDRWSNVKAAQRVGEVGEFACSHDGAKRFERTCGLESCQDLFLIRFIGVAKAQPQEEAIKLGLW